MAQFMTLPDAVAQNLKSGDTAAFEGFTHLIPHASAHEAIRQGIKDLTLVRMTPDVVYDQLIGVGAVRKLIFSYAGNPGVGLLRRLRDSVENGWPNRIEIEEHSHAAMANAYEAGAAGLPFATFRGYKGAGLAEVNQNIRSVSCPFTGEELAAVPAIRPDVTFIHAQKADKKGNIRAVLSGSLQKLAPGSVDLVFMRNVFHHLSTPHKHLKRIFAVLRDGGRLALVEHKEGSMLLPGHNTSLTVFRRETKKAGFMLVKEHDSLKAQHFLIFTKPSLELDSGESGGSGGTCAPGKA